MTEQEKEAEADIFLNKTAAFIKESMCITGTVIFDSYIPKLKTSDGYTNGIAFKCVDKDRGTFFISWTTLIK